MFKLTRRFRRNTLAQASLSPSNSISAHKRPVSRQEQLENQVPHIGEVIRVIYERIQGQPESQLSPVLYYATTAERINERLSKIAYSALSTNAKKYEGAGDEFQMDILGPYEAAIKEICSDKDLQGKEKRKRKERKLERARTRMKEAVRSGKGWRILLWYEDQTEQRGVIRAILTHRDVFMGQRKHRTVLQATATPASEAKGRALLATKP